jgi:hypothetical protein
MVVEEEVTHLASKVEGDLLYLLLLVRQAHRH